METEDKKSKEGPSEDLSEDLSQRSSIASLSP